MGGGSDFTIHWRGHPDFANLPRGILRFRQILIIKQQKELK